MQNALQDLRLSFLFFFYILPQHEPMSAEVPDLACTLTRTPVWKQLPMGC